MAESREKGANDDNNRPVVRDYAIVAIIALVGAFLLQFMEGVGIWALLPLLIGLLGVIGRWSGGAGMYLVTTTVLVVLSNVLSGYPPWHRPDPSLLSNLLLAVCVLGYVIAQMRLLTMANHALPPDRRRQRKMTGRRMRGRWLLPGKPTRRTTASGYSGEIIQLLVMLPVFALVAALLWVRLELEASPFPRLLPVNLWRVFVVLWGLAILLMGCRVLLGYMDRSRAGREESLLYLQDQVWSATRGEQRRIARWLAWGRLRAQARKEGR